MFPSLHDRESNAYNRVNEETPKELRCPTETDKKMSKDLEFKTH